MRVLLTGGNGFVGRHARAALARHDVTAPGREAYALEAPGKLPALLAATRPEAVVHLAAQASVAASFADPLGCWRANLLGTLELAEAVLREAATARLLFASSAEVYGLSFQAGAPAGEHTPFLPANPYAASKAAAELALGEMALRGLNAISLRFFNMAGPGQSPAFVVASFCRQIARIEAGLDAPVLSVGALDRRRQFMDVRDAVRAIPMAMESKLAPGSAFNIAGDECLRIGELLEALLRRARRPIEVRVEPARLRPTDLANVAGDTVRANEAFGWAPEIAWDDTLDDTLADWRARVAAGEA